MTTPSDTVKTAESRAARLSLRGDGIVVVRQKSGIQEAVEDARETTELAAGLAGTPAYVCLIDLRAEFTMGPGVRDFYASRSATRAAALLIGSGFGRVVGNLFFTLNTPKYPTRLFTDENLAIAWLRKVANIR